MDLAGYKLPEYAMYTSIINCFSSISFLACAHNSGHDGILQLVNCYRGSGKLSRKTALVAALSSWQESTGEDISLWLPETYIIRPQQRDEESLRKKPFQVPKPDQREELKRSHASKQARGSGDIWIAKSTAGLKGLLKCHLYGTLIL